MLKTLVWGYTYEFSPIIDELSASRAIDLKVWIGTEKHCTYSRKNFREKDLSFPFKSPVRCPDALYDEVSKDFYIYLEMANRRNHFDGYYEHTMHDYLNFFHQQLDYFYYLLTHHEIDLVMIDTITHYGEDRILYMLAKAMDIHTILISPTLFPQRFFYVFDVDDFGYFNQVPSLEAEAPDEVNVQEKLDLYLKYIAAHKHFNYTWKDAAKDFFKHRKQHAFYKLQRYQKYRRNLRKMTEGTPDLNRQYVYFPLHLQPEMSSCPLGDKFVDQALALETLSEMLPAGWLIYVKENVHQSEYMRGDTFFNRLRNIPNLRIVPGHIHSHKLIQHAQFTATITGTAGWESIITGKNVLAFGRPWYLALPGVTHYRSGLTVDEILNVKFTADELQQAIVKLLTKAGRGETSRLFTKYTGFDKMQNAKTTAASFAKVVKYLEQHPTRDSLNTAMAAPLLGNKPALADIETEFVHS